MNERTKRIYTVYLLAITAAALLITVLRTVAIVNHLDVKNGYFALGTGVHTAANILTLIAVAAALTAGPLLAGHLHVRHRAPHLTTIFSSAFLAFLLLAFAFFHFCEIAAEFKGSGEASTQAVLSSGIAIVFSLIGASGFVISASSSAEYSAKKAISATFVVLFCLMYTMFLYFEPSLPLNADVKLLAQAALLSAALFFLYDARIALGRPRWAARAAVGLAAMVVTASAAFPNLIYYLLYRESVLETPVHDFLILGFFLYILARMTSLVNSTPPPADGFFGEALEMSRLADAEQLTFFPSASELPTEEDGEASAEDELLAPPSEAGGLLAEPSEQISFAAEPESGFEEERLAEAEPSAMAEDDPDLLSYDDLFSTPDGFEEETNENDVLSAGFSDDETESDEK